MPDNVFNPPVPFRGLEKFLQFRRIIDKTETPVNCRQKLSFPVFFFLFVKELVRFRRGKAAYEPQYLYKLRDSLLGRTEFQAFKPESCLSFGNRARNSELLRSGFSQELRDVHRCTSAYLRPEASAAIQLPQKP